MESEDERTVKKGSLLTSSDFSVCLKVKKAILKEHIMYLSILHKTEGREDKEKYTLKYTLKRTLKWARNIF